MPVLTGSGKGFACAVLLVATLSGCASGATSGPQSLAPHHTPPTASIAVPTAGPGTPPLLAGQATQLAAATSVVKRYYSVLNNLHDDMNAEGWSAIFTPKCPCQIQARSVRYARSRGERYIDRVHVLKYTPSVDGPGVADVLVLFNAAKGGMVGPNNQTLSYAAPAQRVHRDFLLVHVEGRWLIARITAV